MNADIRFYLKLVSGRLAVMFALFLIASIMGGVIAMRLPTFYTTSAKLLVEGSQIPDGMVRGTFETNAVEQLDLFQQRLLTRANLLDVARTNKVFSDQPNLSPDEIVTMMRQNTRVRNTSGRNRATVMSIVFTGPTPRVVADVVNQYVTIVLSANAGLRAERAEGVEEFFQKEVETLSDSLDLQAQKIVIFKNQNVNALPENLSYRQNRQTLLQERLSRAGRDLDALEAQRANIERIYASTETLPEDKTVPLSRDAQQLEALQAELRTALGVYTNENPRVKLLRNRIRVLQEQVAEQKAEEAPEAVEGEDPVPAASPLDISLAELDSRAEILQRDIDETSEELDALRISIESTAGNRITLDALQREQENIRNLYSAAVERLAQAQMGERIELSAKGERITVLEPANIPAFPSGPNRLKIAGLGVGAGLGLALGFFVLLELLNQSIRRPVDITRALNITTIGNLPMIETAAERTRRRVLKLTMVATVLIAVPISLWGIDNYYMPLEQLVEKVLARLT